MSWKPIDFQGIVSLDTPLVDLLSKYLEEQESQLAHRIVDAIPKSLADAIAPPPPPSQDTQLKLSEAIDIFSKHHYQTTDRRHPIVASPDCNKAIKETNEALWDYVETLDGCVSELFHQLDDMGLEKWHVRLSHVVGSIKDMLVHKTEDLIWAIRRLENQLWKCKLATEAPESMGLNKLKVSMLWSTLLDRSLISHLHKNQGYLRSHYNKFVQRYSGFVQMQEQVDKLITKLMDYQVLFSLDKETQLQFIKLYQMLKLWDLNRKAKVFPKEDFIVALRNSISVDKATAIFRDYFAALRAHLYIKSLYIKQHSLDLIESPSTKSRTQEIIAGFQAETNLLGHTILNYREFLLQSDHDPYIRTKLGMSDWISGQDPIQKKPLLNLGYDVDALSRLFAQLSLSLNVEIEEQREDHNFLKEEIEKAVHEISNPLASHRQMRNKVENILGMLEQMDELGSFDEEVVPFVGQILSKLMRFDWKYHVEFGFPLFHQLYDIHQGLVKPVTARHHVSRLNKCQKLLNQILEWVRTQKTQEHAHEIELDMNDIKGYLQDFLGYIQRIFSDPKMTLHKAMSLHAEISHELFESRYLFGNFFYRLRQKELEGKLIRRQFLFVDQYFETIEYRLFEIKETQWPENVVDEQNVQQEEEEERSDDD